MTGLVITTYNRPKYLKQCFQSLLKVEGLSDVKIVVVDDCSKDAETIELINDFCGKTKAQSIILPQNKGVANALAVGFNHLVNNGCDKLINLDADAIVSENFLRELTNLHDRVGGIVTGFNTLTKNRRGIPRHPVLKNFGSYCQKRSIGGINMMFSSQLYTTAIRNILTKQGHWDWNVVRYMARTTKFHCTTPSVVQHIGFESAIGNNDNPDVSHDFNNEPLKKVILQAFGIGDIIFSQTIANTFIDKGIDVIWPVLPQFYEQVKAAYPKINFVLQSPVSMEIKNFRTENGYDVIPLRFSDSYMRVPYKQVMRAKYDMMGMDYTKWKEGAMYERDLAKEQKLAELVGAEGEYTLVNRYFTRNNRSAEIPNIQGKVVEMNTISGYSLFDWSTVIENASEIHTVSTSIVYLLELLPLKCKPYIYIRKPMEKDHSFYDYLLQKDYYYMN